MTHATLVQSCKQNVTKVLQLGGHSFIYIYIYTYGSGFLLVFLLLQNPLSWKSELKEHIKRHKRDITFHVPWGPCHGPKTWAKFFSSFFDENHNLNDNPWPYFYHV